MSLTIYHLKKTQFQKETERVMTTTNLLHLLTNYSDIETANSCIQCQSGFTTAMAGSTNSSNCQGGKKILILVHV